jgi:[amino group carrier protein]-lysine/ornithine hydrolase
VNLEPIHVLEGLLHRFSPTGEEQNAVAYLVETMQQLGYQAHIDAIGNAVGTIGTGQREILLLGHIDTVPGEISVRQENNRLYGRGAVDAKGPLASFVFAGTKAKIHSDWRVSVIGAVGEEGNSRGAQYLCKTYPAPEMVIIGEPSGWNSITLGYKGSFWVEASINSPVTHTASGIGSASDSAFIFWNSLTQNISSWNSGKARVFDKITPSIRGMSSDFDGFSETACLKINFRIPNGIDQHFLETMMASCMEETRIHLDIRIDDFLPAYQSEKNSPLVRGFLSGIRKAGGTPGFKLKTGTADMNLVGPAWGIPVVAYGPGDSNLDHTPEEHIEIPEYLSGIQVLVNTLENIQGI